MKIPPELTFPFDIMLEPERRTVSYDFLYDLLIETGVRLDSKKFNGDWVVKCTARIHTKEEAQIFIKRFFEIAHPKSKPDEVEFSGNELRSHKPLLTYLVNHENGHISIL